MANDRSLRSKKADEVRARADSGKSSVALLATAIIAAILAALAYTRTGATSKSLSPEALLHLPSNAIYIPPHSFAVLNATNSRSIHAAFHPSDVTPPVFQIFDLAFLDILGPSPSWHVVATNDSFAFAHEAPIWVEDTDELFFCSNAGGELGLSDWDNNNQVAKISLKDVETALEAQGGAGDVNVAVTKLDLEDSVQMTNGGTGPYKSSLVLVNSGRNTLPPTVTLVNIHPPHNTTVLLDNYFGRQFNSLNDIKILDGKFFFTDPTYGWLVRFRPLPTLPTQLYRFDPETGAVRVVADGFDKCNGLAFDKTGKIAYVADSGFLNGFHGHNGTLPATIYAYDVTPHTHFFTNRRTFAYVDAGAPDGIQVDEKGNVYAGTGDGVQVWNPSGTLLGKFFLGSVAANMAFAGPGRLLIMAETKIYMAKVAANGVDLRG
ncbi:hypothetical protein PLICRDRAFT_314875 [Plicaturopsis crispa FD-325 SS-3]|nr:hypothetical protein PLICRDRAFT_314875 [Plicaturopsis crispa FD-325 SS-3]